MVLNFLHKLDADDQGRVIEPVKFEHRAGALFYSTMVLLDPIIEVTARLHSDPPRQAAFRLQFSQCTMRCGVGIERNHAWRANTLHRFAEEVFRSIDILTLAQVKIDRPPGFIHRAVLDRSTGPSTFYTSRHIARNRQPAAHTGSKASRIPARSAAPTAKSSCAPAPLCAPPPFPSGDVRLVCISNTIERTKR